MQTEKTQGCNPVPFILNTTVALCTITALALGILNLYRFQFIPQTGAYFLLGASGVLPLIYLVGNHICCKNTPSKVSANTSQVSVESKNDKSKRISSSNLALDRTGIHKKLVDAVKSTSTYYSQFLNQLELFAFEQGFKDIKFKYVLFIELDHQDLQPLPTSSANTKDLKLLCMKKRQELCVARIKMDITHSSFWDCKIGNSIIFIQLSKAPEKWEEVEISEMGITQENWEKLSESNKKKAKALHFLKKTYPILAKDCNKISSEFLGEVVLLSSPSQKKELKDFEYIDNRYWTISEMFFDPEDETTVKINNQGSPGFELSNEAASEILNRIAFLS